MKKFLIGTGLTGLVGSRLMDLLANEYEFENLSLETGINILNKNEVVTIVSSSPSKIVLHFAAKTDVDGCEKDEPLGKEGDAWKINVEGTRNIIDACKTSGKKILYISTDFVFDGESKDSYDENDTPSPINWYGVTKYEAEKLIIGSGIPYIIVRISFPYRAKCPIKKDLVNAILERLKSGQTVTAVTDQKITPTFIDDISLAIKKLIETDAKGIFHVVGSSALSPFEITTMIANTFSLDKNMIKTTTGSEYFQNRAKRPFHAVLKNDKIKNLGINMHTFPEGLKIIKEQNGL